MIKENPENHVNPVQLKKMTVNSPEGHDNIHSARSAEKNVRVSPRKSAAN